MLVLVVFFFFFQAEDGIRDKLVTGVQTCALPILTLAREEPGVTDSSTAIVDLASVARAVIGDLAPLAGAKRIDLGLSVADTGTAEIGRASCRERAEMAGVGGWW